MPDGSHSFGLDDGQTECIRHLMSAAIAVANRDRRGLNTALANAKDAMRRGRLLMPDAADDGLRRVLMEIHGSASCALAQSTDKDDRIIGGHIASIAGMAKAALDITKES